MKSEWKKEKEYKREQWRAAIGGLVLLPIAFALIILICAILQQ